MASLVLLVQSARIGFIGREIGVHFALGAAFPFVGFRGRLPTTTIGNGGNFCWVV
ncbi:MAG: hypothetical protein AAGD09_09135 [Cyanobacteria bacterium P01_F01_bin.56]